MKTLGEIFSNSNFSAGAAGFPRARPFHTSLESDNPGEWKRRMPPVES